MERPATLASALITTLLICGPTRGADKAADNPFAQGTWDFSLSGAYSTPIGFSQAHTYNVTAAFGKYLLDNNSLSGELEGYYAEQPDHTDVIIGGVGILGAPISGTTINGACSSTAAGASLSRTVPFPHIRMKARISISPAKSASVQPTASINTSF